jgi:hypothetical protein
VNWVEIVMLVVGLTAASVKLGRWGVRRLVEEAGAARADSLCTCGCSQGVNKMTGVFFQGRWWRLECWKKFNQ